MNPLESFLQEISDDIQDLLASMKSEDTAKRLAEIRAKILRFQRQPLPNEEDYVTGGTRIHNE